MKKILFAFALTAVVAGLSAFKPGVKTPAASYAVDTLKSKITWNGSVADHYHVGVMKIKGGQLSVDNGKISGGQFTLDIASIASTDGAGAKLDGHLKSPDFFDASKFGEAVYSITSVNYTSENSADIAGTLSVNGISAPVKLTAKIRGIKDGKLFSQANFSLDPSTLGFKFKMMPISGIDVTVNLFAAAK